VRLSKIKTLNALIDCAALFSKELSFDAPIPNKRMAAKSHKSHKKEHTPGYCDDI
jgi:hypothetical protein